MLYVFWMMALTAGMVIGTQSAINSRLSGSLGGQPILATLISFVVGTLCLLLLAKLFGQLNLSAITHMPRRAWWQFSGGALGAFFVFTTVLLAPKLGVSNMLLLALLGQLCSGMAIDHFGLFGMPQRPIDVGKWIGLVMVTGGLTVFFYGEMLWQKLGR